MAKRSGSDGKTTGTRVKIAYDPKEFSTVVGEAIRRARQVRGWTQAALAETAGLSPNYVARLERGEVGPSLFVAQQLCDALGIDVDALFRPDPGAMRSTKRSTA